MKLSQTLAATAAAASLSVLLVGTASADPDCSSATYAAVNAVSAASAADAADKAAADAQELYDALAAAHKELAAAVKADNETVPPLTEDSQRTTDAKAALAKAQKAVDGFEAKGVTIETLRDKAAETDGDALHKAAADALAAAREACAADPVEADDDLTPAVVPASTDSQVAVLPDTSEGVDTGAW
jgi:hypothetical protein